MIKRKYKAEASYRRLSLACSVILCILVLLLQGCGDLTPCEGNIGPYTLDPNGTNCTQRCQCNTLVYEGDCVEGTCVSLEREPCTAKGQKRNCLLPKTANRKCDLGVQTCHPEELQNEKRWSDCVPFQVVERENTVELCFDGLDNDCDGKVDLGDPDCAKFCRPKSQEPCYTGPEGTLNVGECKAGVRICEDNHEWGPCKGEITPQEEICGDGKDNNCGGLIDEDCPCIPGQSRACGSDVGECKKGEQRCENGKWSKICYEQIAPSPEECDGKDNNCNGLIDEGCACSLGETRACGSDVGLCQKGLQKCENGKWSDICYGEVRPSSEICDGMDNDCNGRIDDDIPPRECYSGLADTKGRGECKAGLSFCKDGIWGRCEGEVTPQAEHCNGKDDDCNGLIDDNPQDIALCAKQQGVCSGSRKQRCVDGQWQECTEADYRQYSPDYNLTEQCYDGKDNNCNGKIDLNDPACEGFCKHGSQEVCYTGPSSTLNVGECKAGIRTCQADGRWGACEGEVTPQEEICGDGKDNNCDGVVDEGCCLVSCSKDSDCAACPADQRTCVSGKCSQAPQCPVSCSKDSDCALCSVDQRTCVSGKCSQAPQCPASCSKDSDCAACPADQRTCVGGKCSQAPQCPVSCSKDSDCALCSVDQRTCVSSKCSCPLGQMTCSGTCVDLQTDANNCGVCGNKCHTDQICISGKCSCPAGQMTCSGACVNLQTDANNCGKCSNKCNTDQICISGQCGCLFGWMVCSGVCVDLETDKNNCGKCGNKCGTGYNCIKGICNCPLGHIDCSGVCINYKWDTNNCGTCGNKCSTGQNCYSGKCTSFTITVREVLIPAGSFMMGSPSSELGRNIDEGPQRQVTLTRTFAIWKYEVTQEEFEALMGYNPSSNKSYGAKCPVENVSSHEAAAFTNAMSRSQGLEECFYCTGSGASVNCAALYIGQNYYNCKGYRLPTEAEWEYAYRAGTNSAFYNGDITKTGCDDPNLDKIGWYCGNAGGKTHPVGGKQANAWGLHDMAGNVSEWVYDYGASYNNLPAVDPVGTTGSNRVNRGGGFALYARYCRAAFRNSITPDSRYRHLGFRFLRSL